MNKQEIKGKNEQLEGKLHGEMGKIAGDGMEGGQGKGGGTQGVG